MALMGSTSGVVPVNLTVCYRRCLVTLAPEWKFRHCAVRGATDNVHVVPSDRPRDYVCQSTACIAPTVDYLIGTALTYLTGFLKAK